MNWFVSFSFIYHQWHNQFRSMPDKPSKCGLLWSHSSKCFNGLKHPWRKESVVKEAENREESGRKECESGMRAKTKDRSRGRDQEEEGEWKTEERKTAQRRSKKTRRKRKDTWNFNWLWQSFVSYRIRFVKNSSEFACILKHAICKEIKEYFVASSSK